jgi:TolB-like protein
MKARATSLAGLVFLLASSATSFPGCGYALIGQGNILPEHVKVVVVVPFENQTSRPEIEQRVTEAVAREMSRRGKYDVVTDRTTADAMLEGAISAYRTVPVQFSPGGLATRVEAIVTIQATLRDLTSEEILWNQDGLIFRQQFDVDEGEEFFDQETLALEVIAQGAATALVTSILEGF